jgi:SAM-dependent methyltransferase
MKTNYDQVAPDYDGRYARHEYAGTAETLRFVAGTLPRRTLELGCGTGHWVDQLRTAGHAAAGIDPSRGMLHKAVAKLATPGFALARGERLPFADASFELVYAINAVHHFGDPRAAIVEAHRVLVPGGLVLVIGLDPSAGRDTWSLYDFFPGTLERDRQRFPSTKTLRGLMQDAGFERIEISVAEHIDSDRTARAALASGALHKHATSQLSELSDEAYQRGIAAIEAAATAAEARGETCMLTSDLHLFATTAHKPS